MAISTTTVECNRSPNMISPNIKHEKNEQEKTHNSLLKQQTPNSPITFSITNILSNDFGHSKKLQFETNGGEQVISATKRCFSFRSDDADSDGNDVSVPKKLRLDINSFYNDQINDDEEIDVTDDRPKFHPNLAVDFSSALPSNDVHRLAQHMLLPQQQQAHQHHLHQQQLLNHYQMAVAVAQQSMHRAGAGFIDGIALDAHHRSPIYPDFYHQSQQPNTPTLAKNLYPKLHEDILNSSKQYQQYYQTRLLTDSVLAKYPPLGNLCKTVSQIGQSPTGSTSSLNGSKLASPARSETSPSKKSQKRPSSQFDDVPSAVSTDSAPATTSTPASASNETSKTAATTKNHQSNSMDSGMESSDDTKSETGSSKDGSQLWPAWIYCTRYSDRPSSGPRYRKPKEPKVKCDNDEKRPRTAFSAEQLARLKREFNDNNYLNERRRQALSAELGLNQAQIKIWFQNKRAKIKKSTGHKNPLAMQLMAQGLYNHSTVSLTKEEEELEMRMNGL